MMEATAVIKKLADAGFQRRLLAEPRQVLRDAGIEVPAGAEIKVVRNGRDHMNVVIPAKHANAIALSDDELLQIAAGESFFFAGVAFTVLALSVVSIIAGIVTVEATS